MINIYMCRAKSQNWANPPPPIKVLFDEAIESALLGPLIRDKLMRYPNDPKYTIDTIGM